MSLFEDYKHSLPDNERLPVLKNLLIRPALISDVTELSVIQSDREGGEPAGHALRLEKSIISWNATAEGLILVAEHEGRLTGYAKVKHFTPQPDAPLNVAPSGWYLAGVIVAPEYRR